MKKLIVSLIIALFSFSSLFAQVSLFTKFSNGKVIPCATIFGTKMINEKIGFTYFALVNQKWAETYVGLSYSPEKWINIGLSAGIEQSPALYRLASSLWLGSGKTSFLLLTEKGDGQNNYWYKATLAYKVSEKLDLGLRAWRYNGIGPVVGYKIKELNSKIWAMPAYNLEDGNKNLIVGVDITI